MTALSIVVPVYNESAVLPELVRRCRAVGDAVAADRYEVLVVDDASHDETPALLESLADGVRVHALRQPRNGGQFRAVQRGLSEARGALVAVLDGDLQDPPEAIADLVAVMNASPRDVGAVFAVKTRRDDPPMFHLAQWVFHAMQHHLSVTEIPRGASSYCLMRREVAHSVARVPFAGGNLGAVLSAAHIRCASAPYVKEPRPDGASRLGAVGHYREAWHSLLLTGASPRITAVAAALTTLTALTTRHRRVALALAASLTLSTLALAHARRRKVALLHSLFARGG